MTSTCGASAPPTWSPVLVAGAWPPGVLDDGAEPGWAPVRLPAPPADTGVLRTLLGGCDDPWLLLGRDMADTDRLCLLRAVRGIAPRVRLAMLGPAGDADRVSRWLALGCDAYLFEEITAGSLRDVLRLAGPDLVIVDRRCRPQVAGPDDAGLTGREREVLDLLCSGQGNDGMARTLRVSRRTVEFHLTRIFEKLNVTSRTEAVARAWSGAV